MTPTALSRSIVRGRRTVRARRRALRGRRGVALIMVLGALTVLTILLADFQDETSANVGAALSARDALRAEYAARSGVALARLLIAAEPTIRQTLAPMMMLMGGGQAPPQIPVWEFADEVLGAFNDEAGGQKFAALSGVNLGEGRNLGIEGAGFDLTIVDEDSKINLNAASREAFSQGLVIAELLGLIGSAQFDPMFSGRDADGQFSDRQTVCGAIVDWVDRDQDASPCDPRALQQASSAAPEDSFYQLLDPGYQRKNAPLDSLDELRRVRGVGDDFWATFVDPDPDDPSKRPVTVWGQGRVNVNTANAQTLLAMICG
ncbi:MAG: general secretion pathway protein GspK, partial [Deltaproteobacteria bacterium]|nr:general secretion pathway protein GspK [Deltaproteobacteria bacterium]